MSLVDRWALPFTLTFSPKETFAKSKSVMAGLDPAIQRKGKPLFILTFFIQDGRLKGGHDKERSFTKVSQGRGKPYASRVTT
jgi:hypothetical protein